MKRRTFIKLMLAGTGVAVLPLRMLRASVDQPTNPSSLYWSISDQRLYRRCLTKDEIADIFDPDRRWDLYEKHTGKTFYFPAENEK